MDLLSVTTSMSQHTGTSAGASGAWNEGATKVDDDGEGSSETVKHIEWSGRTNERTKAVGIFVASSSPYKALRLVFCCCSYFNKWSDYFPNRNSR